MNAITAGRMEQFAQMFVRASDDAQGRMWEALEAVFTADEINGLKKYVGAYKLLTDEQFYRAAQAAICETMYSEFTA